MEEHKHPGVNLLDRVEPVDTQSFFIHPYRPEPASEWDLYLFGNPGDGSRMHTIFHPRKGQEKNWFQRKMMELFFGVK
jgi:hypothetical protein